MSFIKSPAIILLRDLASKHTSLFSVLRSLKKKRWLDAGKPGEVIAKLPPEDREKLKSLTSEEAQNMLLCKGQVDYMCDDYWEKKSEEDRYKEYLEGNKLKK